MADHLTISVVIVTRNRADWLKDVLESLTRQSRQPDEVVVVDNDSKDDTKETVFTFNNILNIKYVHEAKVGIPYARNAGICNAVGDIIVSIDDDCLADEEWLKYIEKPFVKDPGVGVVGGEVSYLKIGDGSIESFYLRNMIARGGSKH